MADPTAGRIRKIREIVRREPLATQQDLVRALRREGITVTQGTISRDIKRLGLVKVLDGSGRYRYALPGAVPAGARPLSTLQRLHIAFDEFVAGVESALDLILVKTGPGGAPPVAQAIDDMGWPDVAGTIAGEDTILVVPRSRRAGRSVLRRLRDLI
ncbi:MAG: arginine repressor [Armatimonadetes bacterium]|nr:arginine repressor [Armatimonadota bacterium]MBI2247699.1 arginine repressor [Armatimonadota bacterium]MBI2972554.1 arginine repressor [Armatimonadota bacterium]